MRNTFMWGLIAAGAAVAATEQGRNAICWPYRKAQLEQMTTLYILTCGGSVRDREARRQAREIILDGPYNPFQPGVRRD